jgi:lipid II:glycine glycyltransferase (peptidoglycan interpeptide bridge formation enzyme)
MGQKTWLLSWGDSVRALVTKVEAKRGTFLYLPYGPMVSDPSDLESLKAFFHELRNKAREEKASFIRVSPYWQENEQNKKLLESLGFRSAPIHMLAETLWLLDLEGKPEETILMEMEKKHRNLVRRAEKDGVVIKASKDSEAVERFINLHWETMSRHHFTPYPKSYFRQQVELFSPADQVVVFEAYLGETLLASAIIMYYGKAGAYHHGASSSNPEHRKIPASYLLQWEAIREAKKRGLSHYNFWGIAPQGADQKHPFYGITHFKTGFGGRQMDLVPCHDLVISPKYYVNWSVEKFRKWKRGF